MAERNEVEAAIRTLEEYAEKDDRRDLIATVTERLKGGGPKQVWREHPEGLPSENACQWANGEVEDHRKLVVIVKAVDGTGPPLVASRLEIPIEFLDPRYGLINNRNAIPNLTIQLQRSLSRFAGEAPLGGTVQDLVRDIMNAAHRLLPEEQIIKYAEKGRQWFEGELRRLERIEASTKVDLSPQADSG